MKTLIKVFCFFIITSQIFIAQTNVPAGNVSGTWRFTNSPYHINGEITIPNDSTLTIEPGVEVIFTGHYKLNVQGRLLALGTQNDSVRFRAANTQNGWHGIRFDGTPVTNDTSKFRYCILRNGKANTGSGYDRCGGAMLIKDFDKVLISHCLFDSNMQVGEGTSPILEAGPAIYIYRASLTVTNCIFSNNVGSKSSAVGCIQSPNSLLADNIFINNKGKYGAIAFAFSSGGTISGNLIMNNTSTDAAGGLLIDNGSNPLLINNIIVNNKGLNGGLVCYKNGNPVLICNTIINNISTYLTGGGSIRCLEGSNPILINNILYSNSSQSGREISIDNTSDPIILYCNIQGGKSGIGGGSYTGLFENNIDVDPLFVNTDLNNYGLTDLSPCIGAGIDSVKVNGVWYKTPSTCFNGNPRPSPPGSYPDIGACENSLGTPLTSIERDSFALPEYILHPNYPNPFNPTTKISWQSPVSSRQVLKVFDVLGNEVTTLVDEYKPAGSCEVEFDASKIPSGVYFYRLQAGNIVDTKKMVLLK